MKGLVWTLFIILAIMLIGWNYSSNYSRYEHAQYLKAVYRDGTDNYAFPGQDGKIPFDTPDNATTRRMASSHTALPFYDEQAKIHENDNRKLQEMRKNYGIQNVTIKLGTPDRPSIFDWPWTNYLYVQEIGLLCEKEEDSYEVNSYLIAQCFSRSSSDDREQPNTPNQVKALIWMFKAYAEAPVDQKDRILDEYMDLISRSLMTYEMAAADNITPQRELFENQPFMSDNFSKVVEKKIGDKWPDDACKPNTFYWLFELSKATPVTRLRCLNQLAKASPQTSTKATN